MSNDANTRLADGDGLEIAYEEDFGLRRSGGELQAVAQRIPGTEKAIKVRPVAPEDGDEFEDILEGDERGAERVDELFQTHIAEGIGADGYTEGLKAKPYVREGLIQAIKNSKGAEVFQAVQEQQAEELASHAQLIDAIGIENLEQMGDLEELADEATQNGSKSTPP